MKINNKNVTVEPLLKKTVSIQYIYSAREDVMMRV
jgi:hypothetical protein